jgi:hypothetical protein
MSFLPTFFNKSVQLQRYKLLTRLTTYSGSVYALAISNDGNLLACGGKKADTQPYTALINKQVPRASKSGISNLGKNSHLRLTIMNPGEQSVAQSGPRPGKQQQKPSVTEQAWVTSYFCDTVSQM